MHLNKIKRRENTNIRMHRPQKWKKEKKNSENNWLTLFHYRGIVPQCISAAKRKMNYTYHIDTEMMDKVSERTKAAIVVWKTLKSNIKE